LKENRLNALAQRAVKKISKIVWFIFEFSKV